MPAEELDEFNANIVGPIEVIAEFRRQDADEADPATEAIPGGMNGNADVGCLYRAAYQLDGDVRYIIWREGIESNWDDGVHIDEETGKSPHLRRWMNSMRTRWSMG